MEFINVMLLADNYCSTIQKDASAEYEYYMIILVGTFYNTFT